MASRQYIEPFPENIDRTHFASWISGFTDGEGNFDLGFVSTPTGYSSPTARFQIGLRADDAPSLNLIRQYFQCGSITVHQQKCDRWGPTCKYRINRIRYLHKVIVPHFVAFPLMAKKARDFSIWREAVALAYRIVSPGRVRRSNGQGFTVQWSQQDRDHFADLNRILKEQRKFNSEIAEIPVPPARPIERELFD